MVFVFFFNIFDGALRLACKLVSDTTLWMDKKSAPAIIINFIQSIPPTATAIIT